MFPRLIALTVVLLSGAFAAYVGTSGAQEPGSSTEVSSESTSTTVTPPPTVDPLPPRPPADMSLAEFAPLRRDIREAAHQIRVNKCRAHSRTHFRYRSWQIKPWRRAENLNYWRERRARARDLSGRCLLRLVRGTPAQAIRLGKIMAANRGWTGAQWSCLYDLWGPYESSWRWWADNPSSAAYGIPQALPGSKMTPGSNDWVTHTWKQIRWGLGYVGGRYGSPCSALSFRLSNGWY